MIKLARDSLKDKIGQFVLNTQTYNSFTSAGYSSATRQHGVLLKNIDPLDCVNVTDYEYTIDNDTVILEDYTGDIINIIVPEVHKE